MSSRHAGAESALESAALSQVQEWLRTGFRLPAVVEDALAELERSHPNTKFSVRSSAVVEDSSLTSCAGLFHTELDVDSTKLDLEEAIRAVWASACTLGAAWWLFRVTSCSLLGGFRVLGFEGFRL